MATFESRFKNRITRIANTLRPSSSAGETVLDGGILNFKNNSADWRIGPNGRVEIRLHSLTSVNFADPIPNESPWVPCRPFRSVGSLIGALADSAMKGRVIYLDDNRVIPFLVEGSLELRSEIKQWLATDGSLLLNLVNIPSKAGFDPDKEPDKAFKFRVNQLEILVNATRSSTDKLGMLKHRIASEILFGLVSQPKQE